jgi:hypothetical protein
MPIRRSPTSNFQPGDELMFGHDLSIAMVSSAPSSPPMWWCQPGHLGGLEGVGERPKELDGFRRGQVGPCLAQLLIVATARQPCAPKDLHQSD